MTQRNIATRTPRREREWALSNSTDVGASILPNAPIAVDLLADWRTARGISRTVGLTISEIHGHVHLRPSVVEDVDISIRAAAGIGFFPDTTSEATDQPNPLTENWPWQMVQTEMMTFKATAAGATVVPVSFPEIVLDMHTKSMRKQRGLREQLKLIIVFDSSTLDTWVIRHHLRMLLLLQ